MKVIYKGQDISEYVTGMTWSGSKSEVARKLDIKILNAPTDNNIIPPTLELAEIIYLFDDNDTELFRGYIVDREASSTTGSVSYIAYDLLFYTLKSTATYNFSGKTAEEITKMVCEDLEIPVGSLAKTGLSQKLIVQGTSIYEIIMQAYTQAHQQNGISYHVIAKKGYLTVEEMGKKVCKLGLAEDTNITSSKYKESLSNMVNKVCIYDGEGNQIGVVQNDTDLKYGIFQQAYTKEAGKDANTTAKSMFNGVEKTFELSCTNCNECVTGAGVEIRDPSTGLSGLVWIESDTHSWSNGVATMSLIVTLKYTMDTKEFTGSTTDEDTTSGGTPTGKPADKDTFDVNDLSNIKPVDNPPFFIFEANKELYKVQGKINQPLTLEIAVKNVHSSNGFERGWGILDADYRYVPLTLSDISKIVPDVPKGSQSKPPFDIKRRNKDVVLKTDIKTYSQAKAERDKANAGVWKHDNLRYYVYDKDGKVVFDYATSYK